MLISKHRYKSIAFSATCVWILFQWFWKILQRKMRRVPMRLFSRFLKDLAANKIKKVYMTVDKLIVVLRNAENGHGNFYHSMLLPVIDRRYITSLLLEHHVEFGAIPPPVSGKLTPILLASLPFM